MEKHTFGSPELLSAIPAWTSPPLVQEIVVVGFTTDICVVTNALLLKTYFPEILITVDASCCAGTTVERHAAALKLCAVARLRLLMIKEDFNLLSESLQQAIAYKKGNKKGSPLYGA